MHDDRLYQMKKEKRDNEIQINSYKEQRKKDWEMKKQNDTFKKPTWKNSQVNIHDNLEDNLQQDNRTFEKKCIIM